MNKLILEKSPYLQQHANNPVNWYPWGAEAIDLSKKEDKPIFLSSGYSTCYWCHVMEKECFETLEVAEQLNTDFICIKLDREERPDIDAIYMDALMSINGHGGWPLNIFLTPELKPFFGGTYFKKEQFIDILKKIKSSWKEQRKYINDAAEKLLEILKEESNPTKVQLSKDTMLAAATNFKANFDSEAAGFGLAPKFPPSFSLMFLMRYYLSFKDQEVLHIVEKTLQQMAFGGIFDHLGGGFHRYATDRYWLVPHFEKMLYDNALLSLTYLEAYQLTKNKLYSSVAQETINYVLGDLKSSEGAFYSAEDAGEVDREGEFYVWKQQELASILTGEELLEIKKVYGVTTQGNFHNRENILNLQEPYSWQVKDTLIVKNIQQKLLAERKKRKRPHLDNKILTSWNGLMIASLCKAYQVLGEAAYLEAALNCANFIRKNLYQEGLLYHRYCQGDVKQEGLLDDYCFLVQGLISLAEVSFDYSWLSWAIELQDKQDELFWDKEQGGYFESLAHDSSVLVRKKRFFDGAEPSGNSVSAGNLIKLRDFTLEFSYEEKFLKLLSSFSGMINSYPNSFTMALIAYDYYLSKSKQVVVLEKKNDSAVLQKIKNKWQEFLPHCIFLLEGKSKEVIAKHFVHKTLLNEHTTYYLCEFNSCQETSNELERIL